MRREKDGTTEVTENTEKDCWGHSLKSERIEPQKVAEDAKKVEKKGV